jgi:DNA invertase Pin-like site-specific DNA recombinase
MGLKFYISNLNGNAVDGQITECESHANGRDAAFFVDQLRHRDMRGEYWKKLKDRGEMLRPSTRTEKDIIVVTALSALAKDQKDFQNVLGQIKTKNAELVSLENGTKFDPFANITLTIEVWKESKRDSLANSFQKRGARKSADKKKAESEGKAKIITREIWENPAYTNDMIEEMSGLAINTLKDLNRDKWGTRRAAIMRWKRNQRKLATKAA